MESALPTPAANMTASGVSAPAAAPFSFANPFSQIRDFLTQPAIKRSLPLIFMVSLVAAALLSWAMLRTPSQRILFANLDDSDKAAVTQALNKAGIDTHFDGAGSVTVAEDQYNKARMLLAGQDLPKAAPGGYAILDNLPMGVSRAVEGERLRQARESELAESIEEIDAVADARVHLATPEASAFVRDNSKPSASVIVRLQPGRSLSDSQVQSIVNLVASSVPGMSPDGVTIVDQMGNLLSDPEKSDSASEAGDARIDFQRRVEDKYRQQLTKLLTPLVGAGNFSAEVQADVDLDETQATREAYDKDGVLRTEQGNWTRDPDSGKTPAGIPGALSNTPPADPKLVKPDPKATNADGTPATGATSGTASGSTDDSTQKTSEQYARTYANGKEISVTRAVPGEVKRLSVAVLLRDPTTGKPRSKADIQQITELVRAAVGYSQARGDQVTVIARKFSPDATADADKPAWYQADWVPMVARNGTALIIALLVLLLGVRPLAKSLLKKKEEIDAEKAIAALPGASGPGQVENQTPGEAPVSVEMLAASRNYGDRVDLVRGFTRDNPSRAALAVRDMIQADAKG
ncbi:flagellar basal-body MS-ring/collar protein FliF [Stakelama sediminis]|uniref:Flagellar M-ring protein n=1 Tax=Stakelama sediminis TaxID=463200 RepID=A0A840YWV2_9SPHN|nr:flagellar basal-body MS-ring/collar protein FliF [Stakelama sediminis]MBB5718029.1 flagellar M-ring protein FliF [Stakelama sediminis]